MSDSAEKPESSPQAARNTISSAKQSPVPKHEASRRAENLTGPNSVMGSTRTYSAAPHKDKHVFLRVEDLHLDPPRREDSLGRMEHYEILTFVGHGAMGVVLKAFDEQLHRTVAIKVMSPDLIARPSARERFFREARAAAGINHPNVVTIHAVSEYRGLPYLVMEFVDGMTLAQRIQNQAPLPLHDLLRISVQIADGLEAAHRQGIIHRDIKPANIMLEAGIERVKIADFGLARVAMDNSDLTSLGDMIGTPAFMSPEQVDGLELSPRSDLFSFGCVIFAMVAGESPFRAGNALATARRVSSEPHLSLLNVCKTMPTYLSEIVDRLLMKKQADRIESAEKVYQALTIRLAELNRGLNDAATLLAQRVSEQPQQHVQKPRGWRGIAAIMASVALVLALAEGAKFWRDHSNGSADKDGRGTVSSHAADEPLKVTGANNAVTDLPPNNRQELVTVAVDGSADVTSLTEALRQVRPGGVVRVLDESRYEGPLRLDSAESWDGVTLEATNRATLATSSGTILSLRSVRDVTVRGFRFETKGSQHAIEIKQSCPGLTIQNCSMRPLIPRDAGISMVYVHEAASGEENSPIRLRDCVIDCGAVGVVIGGQMETEIVSHVVVEGCRIQASTRDWGVPVALLQRVSNIVITRNILSTGTSGMNLDFSEPVSAQTVEVSWNTFHDVDRAIGLNESAEFCLSKVRFDSNLFLSCPSIAGFCTPQMIGWFQGNVWERTPTANEADVQPIARTVNLVSLRSRDRESPEFLKPDDQVAKDLPGRYGPRKDPPSGD